MSSQLSIKAVNYGVSGRKIVLKPKLESGFGFRRVDTANAITIIYYSMIKCIYLLKISETTKANLQKLLLSLQGSEM